MSWKQGGDELVCSGSTVTWGSDRGESATVHETPAEVRTLMLISGYDILELHHHADIEIPIYVDRRHIIAITPIWARVAT